MPEPQTETSLRTRGLTQPTRFSIEPDEATRKEIAARLDLSSLRKLRFTGEVRPDGKRDLLMKAELGATVVQPCVVTGAPVTTRIDSDVVRRFSDDVPVIPEGDEMEMPEDDTLEPLPAVIDLGRIMEEALSLALPDFPRAQDAEPVDVAVAPPGADPISDEETKPFSSLKSLRDKLGESGDEEA